MQARAGWEGGSLDGVGLSLSVGFGGGVYCMVAIVFGRYS